VASRGGAAAGPPLRRRTAQACLTAHYHVLPGDPLAALKPCARPQGWDRCTVGEESSELADIAQLRAKAKQVHLSHIVEVVD
jgi:hypothetical protein